MTTKSPYDSPRSARRSCSPALPGSSAHDFAGNNSGLIERGRQPALRHDGFRRFLQHSLKCGLELGAAARALQEIAYLRAECLDVCRADAVVVVELLVGLHDERADR